MRAVTSCLPRRRCMHPLCDSAILRLCGPSAEPRVVHVHREAVKKLKIESGELDEGGSGSGGGGDGGSEEDEENPFEEFTPTGFVGRGECITPVFSIVPNSLPFTICANAAVQRPRWTRRSQRLSSSWVAGLPPYPPPSTALAPGCGLSSSPPPWAGN